LKRRNNANKERDTGVLLKLARASIVVVILNDFLKIIFLNLSISGLGAAFLARSHAH